MNILLFITLIACTKAVDYGTMFHQGQRRFTSSDLLQAGANSESIEYDITFVKGYHSLDYDKSIDGILCRKDGVDLFAKKKLINWKVGDVFTGNEKWGCNGGIARKIVSIKLVTEQSGRWKYDIKTTEAQLEDIFEKANELADELMSSKKLFEQQEYKLLLDIVDENYRKNKEMLD